MELSKLKSVLKLGKGEMEKSSLIFGNIDRKISSFNEELKDVIFEGDDFSYGIYKRAKLPSEIVDFLNENGIEIPEFKRILDFIMNMLSDEKLKDISEKTLASIAISIKNVHSLISANVIDGSIKNQVFRNLVDSIIEAPLLVDMHEEFSENVDIDLELFVECVDLIIAKILGNKEYLDKKTSVEKEVAQDSNEIILQTPNFRGLFEKEGYDFLSLAAMTYKERYNLRVSGWTLYRIGTTYNIPQKATKNFQLEVLGRIFETDIETEVNEIKNYVRDNSLTERDIKNGALLECHDALTDGFLKFLIGENTISACIYILLGEIVVNDWEHPFVVSALENIKSKYTQLEYCYLNEGELKRLVSINVRKTIRPLLEEAGIKDVCNMSSEDFRSIEPLIYGNDQLDLLAEKENIIKKMSKIANERDLDSFVIRILDIEEILGVKLFALEKLFSSSKRNLPICMIRYEDKHKRKYNFEGVPVKEKAREFVNYVGNRSFQELVNDTDQPSNIEAMVQDFMTLYSNNNRQGYIGALRVLRPDEYNEYMSKQREFKPSINSSFNNSTNEDVLSNDQRPDKLGIRSLFTRSYFNSEQNVKNDFEAISMLGNPLDSLSEKFIACNGKEVALKIYLSEYASIVDDLRREEVDELLRNRDELYSYFNTLFEDYITS